MKKTLCFIPLAAMLFAACSTTQNLGNPNDFKPESTAASLEEEEQLNEADENNYLIQEEVKVQDVENTVVYVDRPVYVPEAKKSDSTRHISIFQIVTNEPQRLSYRQK